MHCWIQYPIKELQRLMAIEENKLALLDLERGYRYVNNQNGIAMIEFHVDDHEFFLNQANQHTEYGGWLSIRMPEGTRPLIIWGQDECVFHQHRYSSKQWVMPEGQRPLMPKSDGALRMISAYQSRELGFGWKLNEDELQRVNQSRHGGVYRDQDAAIEIVKQTGKKI